MKNFLIVLLIGLTLLNPASSIEIDEIRIEQNEQNPDRIIIMFYQNGKDIQENSVGLVSVDGWRRGGFKVIEPNLNSYLDTIVRIYNDSCIETANWQYVHLNNGHLDLNNTYIDGDIEVEEIKQIGEKSVLANVGFL